MKRNSIYRRLLSLLLATALAVSMVPPAMAASAAAATVQISKIEGTVSVSNSQGRDLSLLEDMRLYNGYHVATKAASYAWLELDSTKLTKLDAVSEVGIQKNGKKLELLLSEGNLFFNVTEPLEDDEILNIRTSTMVVGIRGTCGWIRILDQWTAQIFVLEGSVQCSVTDPVTGETKSAVISGGEEALCVVYPPDKPGTACDILMERFTETDIGGFVLTEVVPDKPLCKEIFEDSGLDLRDWPEEAPAERLAQDEGETAEKLAEIETEQESQDHHISKDPVWEEESPAEPVERDPEPEKPAPPAPPSTITLYAQETNAAEVNRYLNTASVGQVIVLPGRSPGRSRMSSGHSRMADTDYWSDYRIEYRMTASMSEYEAKSMLCNNSAGNGDTLELLADDGSVLASYTQAQVSAENSADWGSAPATYFYTRVIRAGDHALSDLDMVNLQNIFNAANGITSSVTTGAVYAGNPNTTSDLSKEMTWTEFRDTYLYTEGADTPPDNPSEGGRDELIVDTAVTIPAGKTLTINNDVTCFVLSGQTFTVNGTLNGPTCSYGTVVNNGTITEGAHLTSPQQVTGEALCMLNNSTLHNNGMIRGTIRASADAGTEGGNIFISGNGTVEGNPALQIGPFTPFYLTVSGGVFRSTATAPTIELIGGPFLDNDEEGRWATHFSDCTLENTGSGPVISSVDFGKPFVISDMTNTVIRSKSETVCVFGDEPAVPQGYYIAGPKSSYYYLENGDSLLEAAKSLGLLDYINMDDPSEPLTRSQVAGLLTAYAGLPMDYSVDPGYPDCDTLTATERAAIFAISNAGIMRGYTDGTYKPSGTVTKAEITALLYRILTKDIYDVQVHLYANWVSDRPDSYSDVFPSDWCAGYIGYLLNASYLPTGYDVFLPFSDITGWSALEILTNLPISNIWTASITTNAPSTGYTDVSPTAWYAEAAVYCRDNALMSGTSDGTFSPESEMTRAMLVTVLHRLAGSPKAAAESGFSDVPPGAWYADAAAWAAQEGIVSGDGSGRFAPGAPVTREQAAAILWRCAGQPGSPRPSSFADQADISSYSQAAVDWARSSGIIRGLDGNRFDPGGTATRAQTAIIIMNFARGQQSALARFSAIDVMCAPCGIAAGEDGSLLVTDTYHKVIREIRDGVSTVYAGGQTVEDLYGKPLGGYNDASLENSYFRQPWAIAPFLDGWAVSDTSNNAVRLLTAGGAQTVNGHSKEPLPRTNLGVSFDHPTGLAADGEGNLYIADTFSGAIRRVTPDGMVNTVAKDLSEPMGLYWHDGVLYAAEAGANRVISIEDGRVSVVAGSGEAGLSDGGAEQAEFFSPQGIAVGDDGTVYVSDTGNNAVRKIRNGEVSTLLVQDKTKVGADLIAPRNLLVQGNKLYICDEFSRKIFVLQLG